MQTIIRIVMVFSMICVIASILCLFILVILKKRKKVAGICLIVSISIFIINYATDRNNLFDDVADTSGKNNEIMTEDVISPTPFEVPDNLSVTPCYPDINGTDISVINNDKTLNEDLQSVLEEEADSMSITPIPEGNGNQAMEQTMEKQWYMFKRLFVREDGLHTFSMGWYDDGTLECIFDDHFCAAIVYALDNTSLGNVLVYEGTENDGSVKITYYYDDDKIEIIDSLGLDEDYSGVYYLDESSVIEPDFN